MNILHMIRNIFNKKIERHEAPAVVKFQMPMNLSHGSVVVLPDVDLVVATADGSLVTTPSKSLVVSQIGEYRLWNLTVYHCYFADTDSYLELVTEDRVNPLSTRYFTHRDTVQPSSTDEWGFWLGVYQRDDAGQIVYDSNGQAIIAEGGLIGWLTFQIDGPPAIEYKREWFTNQSEWSQPVQFKEKVFDKNGSYTVIPHDCMEYSRQLSTNQFEFLRVTALEKNDDSKISIYVGLTIDHNSLTVLES